MPNRPNRADRAGAAAPGTPVAWPDVDPLASALQLLRMSNSVFCESTLAAPWGLGLPALPGSLMFHVVRSGTAWLEIDDQVHVLPAGSLALLPGGVGHRLLSAPGTEAVDLDRLHRERLGVHYESLRIAGDGPVTSLLCGTALVDHPSADHLVRLLPPAIVTHTAGAAEGTWLEGTLALLAEDARSPRPAAEGMLSRVADVIVLQAVRAWLSRTSAAETGWLGALGDPQVGRALAAVHRDTGTSWTLARLAREAGMSRSAFAARFVALVGEPTMRYVVRWKMHLAADALAREALPLGAIGERLGYESEAAFSRAFKRVHGVSPGAVRRRTSGVSRDDAA